MHREVAMNVASTALGYAATIAKFAALGLAGFAVLQIAHDLSGR